MAANQGNGGVFPILRDSNFEESVRVQEVIYPPIKEIKDFCLKNAIDIGSFFRVMWSLIVRAFAEADVVCIGLGDYRQQPLIGPIAKLRVVQTALMPQNSIAAVLHESYGAEWASSSDADVPSHNTAIVLTLKPDLGEVKRWLALQEMAIYTVGIIVEVDASLAPVSLSLFHQTSAISSGYATNICSTMSHCIQEILAKPNQYIGEVNFFSPRDQLAVSQWNLRPPLPSISLIDTIHARAYQHPDHPAICAWDGDLSYSQLDKLTNRWAIHLQSLGVGPQITVPVMLERSKWAILAEIAILKAGGAFVPMDPSHPQERLRTIVEQLNATIALSSRQFAEKVRALVDQVLIVSEKSTAGLPVVQEDTTFEFSPGDLAYVLFTSGSTGQPKGCMVSHRALADAAYQVSALRIRPGSRVLQFASYSFGVSLIEIYCSLAAGATVCIPSEHDRLNALSRFMDELRVSWAFLTPSTAMSITGDLEYLRTLVLAGEPMSTSHFERWATKVELLQGFGFTEWAGICCVSDVIKSPDEVRTIGTSPTACLWLTDPIDHNKLAPVGAVAELVVEGPALALGYLNSASQTASSFIENPIWLRQIRQGVHVPTRLYKTGDLVRYQADGTLHYIARKDTQVKIRGKRVELGEIEYHIRQACPQLNKVVAEAASPEDGNGVPIIVAFLHSQEFEALPIGESSASEKFRRQVVIVQQSLQNTLPDHMWPSAYLPLKSVPLTISGKTDRRALRELIRVSSRRRLEQYQGPSCDIVAPRTEMEHRLHQLFAEILHLNLDSFGIHHSFVRLGGDSVTAMRLVNRARVYFRLTVQAVLQYETTARLAQVLEITTDNTTRDEMKDVVEVQRPPFSHSASQIDLSSQALETMVSQHSVVLGTARIADIESVHPCSRVQEGMLISQNQNSDHYQMRFVWELRPRKASLQLNVERLQSAWRRICQRYAMLRTVCINNTQTDHYAVQVVLQDNAHWQEASIIHDDTDIDPSTLLARNEAQRQPLDPDLPRLFLFVDASSHIWAVLNINHLVVDAMSVSIISRDLCYFYDGLESLLSPRPANYGDYVHYLRNLPIEEGLSFWKSYLDGIEPCYFPSLNPPNQPRSECWITLTSLAIPLGKDVLMYRAFCRKYGVTIANLFKLSWALILQSFTGSDDVCFGYAPSLRDAPIAEIEDAVGPYINMLLCRVIFTPGQSLLDILNEVYESSVGALEHRHVPLAEIRHHMHMAGEKLMNTGITFPAHVSQSATEPTSISITEIERIDPTEYDLVLVVDAHDDDLTCTMKFSHQFLSNTQAQTIANMLQQALLQIVTKPQMRLDEIDLLSSIDEEQLMLWNCREPQDLEACVHQLILRQCQSRPDALAVDAWDGRWTYRELNNLSFRLAQYLRRSFDIRAEAFVPLCFTKSRWVPIAILAIMRAGGAFVLLDPSYPIARLKEICSQVRAPLILSNQDCSTLAGQLSEVLFLVDGTDSLWWKEPIEETDQPIAPHSTHNNALYAVFTSGSTGVPKGVVVEHHSFCASATAILDFAGLRQDDRVFQFSSYAYNVSVAEHLLSMLGGSCLCIPSELERMNLLEEAVRKYKITIAILTPTVARLLRPEGAPSLSAIIIGGEHVTKSDIETWAPRVRLYSMYGSAECTAIATGYCCTGQPRDSGLIGKGLRSIATWVVNPNNTDQLAPVGVTGELLIEGPGVSRGYLQSRQDHSSPFIASPRWLSRFRRGSHVRRFYRTGDLVQYTLEGNLRYVGRKDTQVKISGQRVELGEIEAACRRYLGEQHEIVAQVTRMKEEADKPTLVALVYDRESTLPAGRHKVFSEKTKLPASEAANLQAHLESLLPRYMVPSLFIPLQNLPLTHTRKIDRKALQQAVAMLSTEERERYAMTAVRNEPITTLAEKQLQSLFADVLHLAKDSIWANSDFFLLGGNSLLAMKMSTSARRIGVKLSVESIMGNPRLSDMAALLGEAPTE